MKLLNWVQFTWDLTEFSHLGPSLPEHYQIAPVTKENEKELRKTFSSAFLLDPNWNPAVGETIQTIQSWLDRAFASETSVCLALRHGSRIIGASVLAVDPDAESHLAPGPCVSMEYRNRGFGTALLTASLKLLHEKGLTRAIGITRANVPVTRFLYPKFGGVGVPTDVRTLLAA
jgi:GNAT superfamily N-acetyltransferase